MDPNAPPAFATRLRRLDLLIEREILRLRGRYQLSLDEFRGLYVSDEHVDQLLAERLPAGQDEPYLETLERQARTLEEVALQERDPLRRLAERFGLDTLECDLIFLALAPEIDTKYETLYAYLNDDVGRKWPTARIAQRLFDRPAPTGNAVRAALAPAARLARAHLIVLGEGGDGMRGGGHRGFALQPSVAQFLLRLPPGGAELAGCTRRRAEPAAWQAVPVAGALFDTLRRLPMVLAQAEPPLLVFAGEAGSGKSRAARALAGELELPLLELDLAALPREPAEAFEALTLELALWPALLRLSGCDSLAEAEGRPAPQAVALARWLRGRRAPTILDVPPGFPWRCLAPEARGIELDFGQGGYAQRALLWRTLPARRGISLEPGEAAALAGRFDFTAGQIEAVLADAQDMARLASGRQEARVEFAHILDGARAGSDQHLGSLATKIRRGRSWEDLVLTPTTQGRVREFAAAVRRRHVVFAEWGFAERLGHSGSLVALFAGASGTGKTMTAGVIAAELDIDLYKVALSGLVSKYIGETEKNLDRVFDVARKANAMLFFDEADALFGKRSEVKDAHDRYANIETAYLLQKLEEHPGVVVLATNVKRNIDDAFTRRLQYVIEFPVPETRERERLWRGMFPSGAPLRGDIDFGFLARQFPLAGGHIRNVALDAAFLAAQAEGAIDMRRIVQALARQYAKQGKIPSPSEFGPYHALLAEDAGGTA